MSHRLCVACWAAWLITGAVLAQNQSGTSDGDGWTRFRGPQGGGVSLATNIPITWSPNDYTWKTALPGRGHSSPVIWGDRVFIAAGDAATAKRMVLCLDTRHGSILWQHDYPSMTFPQNRDNSYASSTPAVDADHVYVYWTTADEITLLALDHAGKEAWQRKLGPFTSQHGSGASPVVFQDLVVLNNEQEGQSSLIALDHQSGTTRWQTERRTVRAAYSTPCLFQPENGPAELVFTSTGHGISSINPQNGRTNWEFTNAFPFRVVGSPVAASGLIVATCGEGGIGRRLVAVRPGSADVAPRLIYEMKTAIPYVPTPLSRDGMLFLWSDNGLVTCHRAVTGERVWQIKIPDSFYGSPVWINRHLYCMSKTGNLYVLAVSEKPEIVATIPLGEPSFATPAVAGGALFLRTESHLLAIGKGR